MSIRSLLLGSAAVVVVAATASAADATVIESEPVVYVRVCDAYGAGWFYIPGTETCIKFDGDIRVQYGYVEYDDEVNDETSLHEFNYRSRLNVRAISGTEFGSLSSRVRFSASGTAGTANTACSFFTVSGHCDLVSVPEGPLGHHDLVSQSEGPFEAKAVFDVAELSLGGLHLGYSDNYWTVAGRYGYYQARFDGSYGRGKGLFFEYSWSDFGFRATVGAECKVSIVGENWCNSYDREALTPYAGLTFAGKSWYLAGMYFRSAMTDEGAWKVRADYNFSPDGSGIGGWYMSDHGETDYVKGHAWGVTVKLNMADDLSLFGGYSAYTDEYNTNPAICDTPYAILCAADASANTYTIGMAYIFSGLLIQPEWTSQWFKDADGNGGNFGRFSLRIVRSF